jgi:hypothetical protein
MRKSLVLLPLLLGATPALAQSVASAQPAEPKIVRVTHDLTDPANIDRLAQTMQAVSQALMNVKVGDARAALEGREASPRERNETVGDLVRRKDPNFDRDVQQQMASIGPMVKHSMRALNRALPQVLHDIDDAQRSLDRALANMPDPSYPQR